MARLNYTNFAQQTELTQDVSSSATAITVESVSGFPPAPFMIIVDPDLGTEEIMKVTAVAGTQLTVDRAIGDNGATGGGSPFAHSVGATVKHGATAAVFNDMAKVFEVLDDGNGGVVPPLPKPVSGLTWGDLL